MTFTEGSNSTLAKATTSTDAGSAVTVDLDIKVRFGQEIRRFKIPSTFRLGQLQAHIQMLFSVPSHQPLVLLYRDGENDFVTMTFDEELKYAISESNGLLHLEARLAGQPQAPVPVAVPVPEHTDVSPSPKHWKKCHKERHGHHGEGFSEHPAAAGPWAERGRGRRCHRPQAAEIQPDVQAPTDTAPRGRARGEFSEKLIARHVKDITIPDGTIVQPGVPFVKTWRVRNAGTIDWPEKTNMIFISHKGDHMGGPDFVGVQGPVQVGGEVDVSVDLVAPQEPGDYSGFWRMCTAEGKKFGQRFWVSITVAKAGDNSSSEGSGLEQVPVPNVYEQFVKQIQDMGFTNVPKKRLERLLIKFGGNVDTVVAKLNARREKLKNKEGKGCGNKKH